MIEREIRGDSGLTKLKIQIDGDEASVLFRVDQGGAIATFLDTFKTEDFINLGKSLTLNELADQIKSDAIIDAKLLRGDFNSL
tara:strand:- start:229 stop:477 length:249 start_codon:yes stop_codon:yes gene_type:complete